MGTSFRTRSERADGMSPAWAATSRIALLLTIVIVAIMPLTEYLWHFDKFLRGGQDCELGILSIATLVCLILVMLQHGKRGVAVFLAARRWIWFIFPFCDDPVQGMFCGLRSDLHSIAVPSPALSRYTLPQQV